MKLLMSLVLLSVANIALADEVSLVSGFYRSTSSDTEADATEISLGARYGAQIEKGEQWFFQGQITQTSFSGDNAPEDQSLVQIGGGKRYFFKKLSPRFIPYLSWLALLSNGESGGGEQTGVFYSGQFGIRMPLSSKFLVAFESNLFTSALTATDESDDGNGGTNKTKRTELFVDSVGGFSDTIISVGYRL